MSDEEIKAFIVEELKQAIVPGVDTINISGLWVNALANKKMRDYIRDVIWMTEGIVGVLPEEVHKFFVFLIKNGRKEYFLLAQWLASEFRLDADLCENLVLAEGAKLRRAGMVAEADRLYRWFKPSGIV